MKFLSDIEVEEGLKDSSGSLGSSGQVLSSTATGTTWIEPSTIVAGSATAVEIECKNTSGSTITKGTPVYQTGTVGATSAIEVAPADALYSTNKNPAIGLLKTDLINNAFGFVVVTGELLNITTSPIDGVVPVTGDKVFLKSGGGLTLTKPTTSLNGIQNLGLIGKVAIGSAGSITVSSIMRTNDVPNLPEGRIWVGDGNTLVSDTIYIDEPNLRLGIGTTSPTEKLHVDGNARVTGAYYDSNNSAGSNGQVLSSTATGTAWADSSPGSEISENPITAPVSGTLWYQPAINRLSVFFNNIWKAITTGDIIDGGLSSSIYDTYMNLSAGLSSTTFISESVNAENAGTLPLAIQVINGGGA